MNLLMKKSKQMQYRIIILGVTMIFVIALSACAKSSAPNTITDNHGLAYSNDGKEVWIPAHHGIIVYREGTWTYAPGDKNDYMGFSMTDDGFYSSGHPAPGSDLPNPLGIIKSSDKGKTIETLALGGGEDFHGLAVGYSTHTLFAFNSKPNEKMASPGFYSSTDGAKTWKPGALKGISGQPVLLAAHPADPKSVSIGTNQGIFVSQDFGNTFDKLTLENRVSALSYATDGSLIVGTLDGKLLKQTGEQWTEIAISVKSEDDIITFVAQSPNNPDDLVVATEQLNIWMSNDQGTTWELIVNEGKLQ
jgi:hypothetical protein